MEAIEVKEANKKMNTKKQWLEGCLGGGGGSGSGGGLSAFAALAEDLSWFPVSLPILTAHNHMEL